MKLTRIAQLGAVAAVAALTLTACAANEGGSTAPTSSESQAAALSGNLVGQPPFRGDSPVSVGS